MSLENARAIYPIMAQLARDLSLAAKERRPAVWVSYDDLCVRCKEVGLKETPRTIVAKLLKPLQAACLEKNLPDLSALIIAKAQSPGRLRQPDPPRRRLVGTLCRQQHDRGGRDPVLVQGVSVRPRLRRLARRSPVLNPDRLHPPRFDLINEIHSAVRTDRQPSGFAAIRDRPHGQRALDGCCLVQVPPRWNLDGSRRMIVRGLPSGAELIRSGAGRTQSMSSTASADLVVPRT